MTKLTKISWSLPKRITFITISHDHWFEINTSQIRGRCLRILLHQLRSFPFFCFHWDISVTYAFFLFAGNGKISLTRTLLPWTLLLEILMGWSDGCYKKNLLSQVGTARTTPTACLWHAMAIFFWSSNLLSWNETEAYQLCCNICINMPLFQWHQPPRDNQLSSCCAIVDRTEGTTIRGSGWLLQLN